MKRILNNLHYMFALIVMLTTFSSCEKWFDVSSRVDVKEKELFKTESGFFDAIIGVYSTMSDLSLYGDKLTLSGMDILAYNYTINNQAPVLYTSLAAFDYKNSEVEVMIKSIWTNMYNGIANINNILTNLENADRTIFDKGNYEIIKGEALALRAFLHFDILRMFGPSATMNDGTKFMPYVKNFGHGNTSYLSFNEVIDLIIADIDAADNLLKDDIVLRPMERPANVYLLNRDMRMNLFAVKALKARVMLYAGKDKTEIFDHVTKFLELMSTNINFPRLTTRPQEIDKDKLIVSEMIFSLYVDKLSDISSRYFPSNTTTSELTNSKTNFENIFEVATYDRLDARYDLLIIDENGLPRIRKFRQELSDGQKIKNRVPMFKLSEVYYIAAECAPNLETATDYINSVRAARRLYDLVFESLDDVYAEVYKEYRKEFIGEGQLFFLYKRLNLSNIPDCELNIGDKLSEVYKFPLPQQEDEWENK